VSRSTAPGGRPKASQRPSSQHVSKRKANELASYDDLIESTNRRPAPGAGSAPLPAISSVMGEVAAVSNRQHGPPEGGVTYASVLAGAIAPLQPCGSLKTKVMGSDLSEPAVSSETANRHMSSETSGPLSDKSDGNPPHVQVNNTCSPGGNRPKKTRLLLQVLVTSVPTWPDCGLLVLAA